jgi:hypothetical protein
MGPVIPNPLGLKDRSLSGLDARDRDCSTKGAARAAHAAASHRCGAPVPHAVWRRDRRSALRLQRVYTSSTSAARTRIARLHDGRTHPSIRSQSSTVIRLGWWEGDTLVVDNHGYNGDFWTRIGERCRTPSPAYHRALQRSRVRDEMRYLRADGRRPRERTPHPSRAARTWCGSGHRALRVRVPGVELRARRSV